MYIYIPRGYTNLTHWCIPYKRNSMHSFTTSRCLFDPKSRYSQFPNNLDSINIEASTATWNSFQELTENENMVSYDIAAFNIWIHSYLLNSNRWNISNTLIYQNKLAQESTECFNDREMQHCEYHYTLIISFGTSILLI